MVPDILYTMVLNHYHIYVYSGKYHGLCPKKYGIIIVQCLRDHVNTSQNSIYHLFLPLKVNIWVKCKVLYWQKTVNQGSDDFDNHCANVAPNTPKTSLDSLHTESPKGRSHKRDSDRVI